MAELAYVESHGFNLASPVDINQVPQSRWAPVDSRNRPYPIYQGITSNSSRTDAISNYHSLQALRMASDLL